MDIETATRELTERLTDIEKAHAETFKLLLECRGPPTNSTNEELVDLSFMMREAENFCEDLRKELRGARDFLGRIICMRWLHENLNTHDVDMSIRGKLAMGTPQVRTMASLPLPEKDPEAFVAFMKRIGVFGQALKRSLVKVHWPAVTDYLTDLIAKGKPLPPGIDPNRTYSVYQVILRKRS